MTPPSVSEVAKIMAEYEARFAFLDKIIERYAIPNATDYNWGHKIREFLRESLLAHEARVREEAAKVVMGFSGTTANLDVIAKAIRSKVGEEGK